MANILDYIAWRGDIGFDVDPFNEVDGLIFSTLMYIEFEKYGINLHVSPHKTIRMVGEEFAKNNSDEKINTGRLIPDAILALLDVMSRSERYCEMTISDYVSQIDVDAQKQFAAMVIDTKDDALFVAFRGTDDTLIGWKEDFNMCFKSPVPAQLQAVEYLDRIASGGEKKLRLGGHSKGGNLAVFSAAFCKKGIEDRIVAIYSYDGPGFTQDILGQMTRNNIMEKVRSIIPEASVIGMLMEHGEQIDIVASTSNGIFQHDPFSWEVSRKEFVEVDAISARAYKLDHTLRDFMLTLNDDQKRELIDSFFGILLSTGAKTLSDLSLKELPAIFKNIRAEDDENKQLMLQAVKLLMQSAYGQRLAAKKAKITGQLTGDAATKSLPGQ